MLITPNNVQKTTGSFFFGKDVTAKAHGTLCADIFSELWQGYTYRTSKLTVENTDKLIFTVGNAAPIDCDGYDYALNITEGGIYLASNTQEGLARGFISLIERIEPVELSNERAVLKLDCCEIRDNPALAVRMVHICVFPETDLLLFRRIMRMCGMLKYSHVVLEFWGMLKFDCMKELAWDIGFTKDEVRPILDEVRAMGAEIVPMFNHWGHATACRLMSGKHVVLDQNPALQMLFSPDGWSWDLENQDVRKLHRAIRRELCELCGEGDYFHLGCDEVYECEEDIHMTEVFLDYLRELTDELLAEGRRPIIWGDMFLYDHGEGYDKYHFHCKNETIEKLLFEKADRRVLIADWEYNATKTPLRSSLLFKEQGFDVICCPWDNTDANVKTNVETVKENSLCGIMHTTWHTLTDSGRGMRRIVLAARLAWQGDTANGNNYRNDLSTRAASAWRKIYFTDGDYRKSGWTPEQIQV